MNTLCEVCGKEIPAGRQRKGAKTCSVLHDLERRRAYEALRYTPRGTTPMYQTCVVCNLPIPEDRKKTGAKTCSTECGQHTYDWLRQWTSLSKEGHKLSTGTTGAISELAVATDLLRRGFEVFRSLSPTASCDLAILRGDRFLRVEVKTGYVHPGTRRLVYPKPKANRRFDLYAINTKEGVHYIPSLADLDN